MRTPLPFHLIAWLGFVAACALIGGALYFEHVMGMEPCPLCMMQRILTIACGIVMFIAALHNADKLGWKLYAVLGLVFSIFGMSVAGRQIWLQNLPADEVPACGPSLDYMVETLPWSDVLAVMIRGSGNCAEVHLVMGVPLPYWSLLAFIGFTVAFIGFGLLKNKRR